MSLDKNQKSLLLTGKSTFAIPAVAAANAGAAKIVTDVSISTLTAGVLTIAAQPDYARTLKCILTDANASITGATVTIVGVDQNGVGITEVVTFTGAGNQYTSNAFSKVVSATWALTGGTVTTTDDKIAIGYGTKLGLIAAPGAKYRRLIKAEFNGGDEAGTFDKTYGVYTPAGTLDGKKALEVTYLYELGQNWAEANS